MKNTAVVALSLSLALCAFCLGFDSHAKAQTAAAEPSRKPVVVELFTSEGCSTCPPADALLQKLQEQQPIAGADVIALEEHVDYWNSLGWTDPYSSAEYTQRQAAYAIALKNQEYTPQMVVDGRAQFIGSSERDAAMEIAKAARSVQTDVTIASSKTDPKGSQEFSVAVGEDGLESSVNRGENSGQRLHHAATLRSLRKIGVADPNKTPSSFTGDPRLKLDSHWNAEKLRVVVFVQEKKSRVILGAASAKISH
jgi:hypothetical protein